MDENNHVQYLGELEDMMRVQDMRIILLVDNAPAPVHIIELFASTASDGCVITALKAYMRTTERDFCWTSLSK